MSEDIGVELFFQLNTHYIDVKIGQRPLKYHYVPT